MANQPPPYLIRDAVDYVLIEIPHPGDVLKTLKKNETLLALSYTDIASVVETMSGLRLPAINVVGEEFSPLNAFSPSEGLLMGRTAILADMVLTDKPENRAYMRKERMETLQYEGELIGNINKNPQAGSAFQQEAVNKFISGKMKPEFKEIFPRTSADIGKSPDDDFDNMPLADAVLTQDQSESTLSYISGNKGVFLLYREALREKFRTAKLDGNFNGISEEAKIDYTAMFGNPFVSSPEEEERKRVLKDARNRMNEILKNIRDEEEESPSSLKSKYGFDPRNGGPN